MEMECADINLKSDCDDSMGDSDASAGENTEMDVSRSVFHNDIDSLLPEIQADCSEVEDLQTNYRFFDVDCQKVLLVLSKPCTLHFYGAISVKCLAGCVETCGYILNPLKPLQQMYSCEGSSALYFSTVEEADNFENEVEINSISDIGISFMEATKICNIIRNGGCALLLGIPEKAEFTRERYGNRGEARLGMSIDTARRSIKNKVTIPPELMLDVSGITVICGGRGVGKSTTLRYLTNRCLNSKDKLLYIDLDIGQPEFTLQECISAVIIEQPLLGPSYTHFHKPFISFNVGNIDASHCVNTYLRAVEILVTACRSEYSHLPWVVNTMGFSKGIGVYITTSVLAILSPDSVIQIEGKKSQNFPSHLTPQYVSLESSRNVSKYSLLIVNRSHTNVKDSRFEFMHSNKQIRWIMIESYFSSTMRPSYPLICPIQLLTVYNMTTNLPIPEAHYKGLVSKIVTLSTSESVSEPPEVLDFGVILSYVESHKIFLIHTPLEPCNNIKSILVGSLQIPSKLNQALSPSTKGLIPFVQISKPNAAPTVKPLKRQYRFLFEPSFRQQADDLPLTH